MERINAVPTSFFGKGAINLLPAELQKMGLKRGLIVTDKFLYESGAAEKVGAKLLEAGAAYAIYYQVQPNPTVNVVNECINAARALQVDFLVAVGGGSAIDTSKAVSIVLANGGTVEQYEGTNISKIHGLPIVAINTTAGTGSEVTSFYIVTDPVKHSKMVMSDTNCMVTIAINDIDFMMSMPPKLTASTGMDVMTHAIEAVCSKRATPLTDKDAVWAITKVKDYLPRACENGNDEEARTMMAYAENIAGMAFSNGGLGMVHAMAHALGGFYNLPHGVCNAVLLPNVMDFNGRSAEGKKRFQTVAKALELSGAETMNGDAAVKASVAYIRGLNKTVGIVDFLKDLKGVNPKDFPALADLALHDSCMADNIVSPSKEEVIGVYQTAYGK